MIGMDELAVGKSGTVRWMEDDKVLLGYGLGDGVETECLFAAPFSGMKAYRVRGTVLCIRKEDARKVWICVKRDPEQEK